MHMIFRSMLILASTELTKFLYTSCRKKLPHLLSGPPLLAPGAHAPAAHTRRYWCGQELNLDRKNRKSDFLTTRPPSSEH